MRIAQRQGKHFNVFFHPSVLTKNSENELFLDAENKGRPSTHHAWHLQVRPTPGLLGRAPERPSHPNTRDEPPRFPISPDGDTPVHLQDGSRKGDADQRIRRRVHRVQEGDMETHPPHVLRSRSRAPSMLAWIDEKPGKAFLMRVSG